MDLTLYKKDKNVLLHEFYLKFLSWLNQIQGGVKLPTRRKSSHTTPM